MNLLPTSQDHNPYDLIGAQRLIILGSPVIGALEPGSLQCQPNYTYARMNEQTIFYPKKLGSTICETKRLMDPWVQGSVHFRRPTDHDR